MSAEKQFKILQLCKGMTLKQAMYRLELMERFLKERR